MDYDKMSESQIRMWLHDLIDRRVTGQNEADIQNAIYYLINLINSISAFRVEGHLDIYNALYDKKKATCEFKMERPIYRVKNANVKTDAFGRTNKHQKLGITVENQIMELYESGMTQQKIADALKISRHTVYSKIKKRKSTL